MSVDYTLNMGKKYLPRQMTDEEKIGWAENLPLPEEAFREVRKFIKGMA